MSCRIRSSARNAQWPSFMWQTRGFRPSAAQRADAADAEDDLLADPHVAVAAVELAGDVLQIGAVLGDVGVEQVPA